MLKDRRALLEHDLKIVHDQASMMYLEIVTKNEDQLLTIVEKLL